MGAFRAGQEEELRVAPAEPQELDAGLALAFGHLSTSDRSARTEATRRAISEGHDSGQLWLARQAGVLKGAVWIGRHGADSATLAEPRMGQDASRQTATRLLAAALASLESRGVRWIQAL